MAPRPKLHLENFLPYRLSVLSNTVSGAIAAAYFAHFGLTIPEWRVMAVLAATPGLSAAEVAARLGAPPDVVAQQFLDALLLPQVEPSNERRGPAAALTAEQTAAERLAQVVADQIVGRLSLYAARRPAR